MAKCTMEDCDLSFAEGKNESRSGLRQPGPRPRANLRDSGMRVVKGLYEGSRRCAGPRSGRVFESLDTGRGCQRADVGLMLAREKMAAI